MMAEIAVVDEGQVELGVFEDIVAKEEEEGRKEGGREGGREDAGKEEEDFVGDAVDPLTQQFLLQSSSLLPRCTNQRYVNSERLLAVFFLCVLLSASIFHINAGRVINSSKLRILVGHGLINPRH